MGHGFVPPPTGLAGRARARYRPRPAAAAGHDDEAPGMKRSRRSLADLLRRRGLRPTRQRLVLAGLLFDGADKHLTAEDLHGEALRAGRPVALATVYNSLHQFTEAGLLRKVIVDPGRLYFDTNTDDHHHIYHEDSGRLEDVGTDAVEVGALPPPPKGTRISRVDVTIRVSPAGGGA